MNTKVNKTLLSISTAFLLLTGCGDSSESEEVFVEKEAPAKKLPHSPTVQEAFDAFNAYSFEDTNISQDNTLIDNLLYTLEHPFDGDESPDIRTSIAIIDLFKFIQNNQVISKYINISLSDYPTLVKTFTEFSESNEDINTLLDQELTNSLTSLDVVGLLNQGFSNDIPEPSHQTAIRFKELSDALVFSFPDENYVFQYWEGGLNGYDAKLLRVGLLTTAAVLEWIASFSYGVADDYKNVLTDPVSLLNSHEIFVFKGDSESISRLQNAESLLIEALELAKTVNIDKLPQVEGVKYRDYLELISSALDNLKSKDGANNPFVYVDYEGVNTYIDIDLNVLFNPEQVIDISDFGTFDYECPTGYLYSSTLSESNGTKPLCDDGSSVATVVLKTDTDTLPSRDETNFDELVKSFKWGIIGASSDNNLFFQKLFETLNDAIKSN